MQTVGDHRQRLVADLFYAALNQRLYKLAVKGDAPFYQAQASSCQMWQG